LRYDNPSARDADKASFKTTANNQDGMMILPGKYTVDLAMNHDGKITEFASAQSFEAKVLNNTTLPANDRSAMVAFHKNAADTRRVVDGAQRFAADLKKRNENIRQLLQYTYNAPESLQEQTRNIARKLKDLDYVMNGTDAKASFEEVPPEPVSISYRMWAVLSGTWGSSSEPTQTMKTNLEIIHEAMPEILEHLEQLDSELNTIESTLNELKAPYTPGRLPKMD
jgi:hypothetical protein